MTEEKAKKLAEVMTSLLAEMRESKNIDALDFANIQNALAQECDRRVQWCADRLMQFSYNKVEQPSLTPAPLALHERMREQITTIKFWETVKKSVLEFRIK